LKSKPAGALRLAFRLPIHLYRRNLGWQFEQRFLTPEENHAANLEYARRHPLAFRVFVKAFGLGYPLKALEDER
jgi:hypothetical protein